jgi:hypothetical protein
MNRVESGLYLQAPAAAVAQLNCRAPKHWFWQSSTRFLGLYRHRDKLAARALTKTLLPLIELPGSYIMLAAVCRYALPARFLLRYQLTPTLRDCCSVMPYDSRMPLAYCLLKVQFTQRSVITQKRP